MKVYTTTQDYIDHNIAPGLGDVELTDEQAWEVAHRMTEWHDEFDGHGNILGNFSGLVERDDIDFWDVVADVLGDN